MEENDKKIFYSKGDNVIYYSEVSDELLEVIEYMKGIANDEYPSLKVGSDYFIVSVLNHKVNYLYKVFDKLFTNSMSMKIYSSFIGLIKSKSVSAIKPGREIQLDDSFVDLFYKNKESWVSFGYPEGADIKPMNTISLFVTILENDEYISSFFKRFGVSINNIVNEIAVDRSVFNLVPVQKKEEKPVQPRPRTIKILTDGAENVDMTNVIAAVINNNPQNNGMPNKVTNNGTSKCIKNYCSNLNDLVAEGKIDDIVGREREVNAIIRALGRKKKNNIILLGADGVGKTAICESIAYKIVNGDVPKFLEGKVLVSLDMTALMAGTTLRGMFEERVKGILDEIKSNNKYILFIDNIGAVLADKGKNDYDISSMLSRSLENGECQVIGTSDFASYRKTFDKDPSLARRFQKLVIEAPTMTDTFDIMEGIRLSYETFHDVKYTDDAINACVILASKYITERNLPDSAIDILDEAGSKFGTLCESKESRDIKKKIIKLKKEVVLLSKDEDYEKIDKINEEINDLVKKSTDIDDEFYVQKKKNKVIVTQEDIYTIVSERTGIPISDLSSDDKKKLSNMNERLKQEVIGQDKAIDIICKSLKRNRIGLRKHGCMFSALFHGTTGIGKTLIAKKLAKEIFGDEKALIRFDMSEYPDKSAVNKLIGSNPGYVGYEEGGQLTEKVKNHKYCVLLLDEIEKADPEVYNIFLQVLDEGFLTDNAGMKVDFSNVIILFTSNVGAKAASDFGKGIGFSEDEEENKKAILERQMKNKFPPEFINRLDNIIYFNSLTDDNIKQIIRLELNKSVENVKNIGYSLEYDDNTVDKLLELSKDSRDYGARPIMRLIRDNIEDKVTDLLIDNEIEDKHTFICRVGDDGKFLVV